MFAPRPRHCALLLAAALTFACKSRGGPAPAGSAVHAASSAAASGAPIASSAPVASSAPAPPPPPPVPNTPEGVAKRYLELGGGGDLSRLKELVDPQCHATKVGEADAVRMLGARMTVTSATATVESQEGDTATVKYAVKGSVNAKEVHTETDIFGKKVELKATGLIMTGITQQGNLTLKKIDGKWVVTC